MVPMAVKLEHTPVAELQGTFEMSSMRPRSGVDFGSAADVPTTASVASRREATVKLARANQPLRRSNMDSPFVGASVRRRIMGRTPPNRQRRLTGAPRAPRVRRMPARRLGNRRRELLRSTVLAVLTALGTPTGAWAGPDHCVTQAGAAVCEGNQSQGVSLGADYTVPSVTVRNLTSDITRP